MDLQVFVSETLKQLIAAVKTAQESAKQLGGRVVPDNMEGGKKALSGHAVTEVEFDVAAARRNIESVRPGMQIFEVSSKTGFGMQRVFQLLRDQLAPSRATSAALWTETTQ